MPGIIAIVGRPNVGKSALFNRLAGRRIAIVHDQPGVTRDRVTAEAEWQGRTFTLVDTGGIGLRRREKAADVITEAALHQVDLALQDSDVILFVVNVQEGIVPLDQDVAERLRATRKPVILVVNKVDHIRAGLGEGEFTALGFETVLGVSAIHGHGVDALLAAATAHLPHGGRPPEDSSGPAPEDGADAALPDRPARSARPPRPTRLAIVGRPNVGKSSIINKLTGSDRVVVSPIPGTTRDAIDVPFEVETAGRKERYILVDTAGLRKARRVDDTVERFSVERTRQAIARSDITVLVLDAESGILEQDKKVADIITEERRACILVINKWDLVAESVRKSREEEIRVRSERSRSRDDRQKRLTTLSEFGEWVQERLFFLDYAPVIFTSAATGFQLERLLEAVRYVSDQLQQRVPTAILNRTIQDAIQGRQPVSATGRQLKFYYATQLDGKPPTFLLFVNRDDDFSDQYTRYLTGEMRKTFGFEGCPIVLIPRARPKTIEPVRRPKKHPFAKDKPWKQKRDPSSRTKPKPKFKGRFR